MSIKSRNSKKTLGIVSGTLVIRCPLDEAVTTKWFEDAIAKTVLKCLGPATEHKNDTIVEVRCPVEYGPVLGAHPSDITRRLEDIADGREHAVTGITRRDVPAYELPALIATLEKQVDDINLSLKQREHVSETLRRLRAQSPKVAEVRS